MKISAVILARNEEDKIRKCLKNLSWCDEIIVIDDNSTDKTPEIARAFRAKVFRHSLNGDFASQRNFGLAKAKKEWVLFIDADERVSNELKEEILLNINNHSLSANGFFIPRRDFLFGRWLKHGETGKIKFLRLAKKGTGKWERKVHEFWRIKGKLKSFRNPINHFPHRNVAEFLKDINFYTTLNAQFFYEKGKNASLSQIILYPLAKFCQNYFLRLGFLDKMPGFLQACFMSFHSFLTRAKLWILSKKISDV